MAKRRPHVIVSRGNRKVGKDTLIMNITSATDCASRARGLCQIPPGACYALRDEHRYPDTLPYRRRQTKIWDALSPEEIAEDIRVIVQRRRGVPIKYLRMQESGDFRNLGDLMKLSAIADLLKGAVTVYTYTARRDLVGKAPRISSNLVINGSGFMADNNFKVVNEDQVRPGPKCRGLVGGGCYGCFLCKTKGKRVIQEVLRGSLARVGGDGKGGVPQHMGDTGDLIAEEKLIGVSSPSAGTSSRKKKSVRTRRDTPGMIGGLR